MKNTLIVLILLFGLQISFGQTVSDQKEAERIYKEGVLEDKSSRAYFAEDKKCRNFIREKNYAQAENSCLLSVSLAEKLSKSRYMEKHSAYKVLGAVLLWNQKAEKAIPILEKSLEVAKPELDETNAETGEVYFLLGQANQLLGKIETARDFYTKAENTYHLAIKDIDAVELSYPYFRAIKTILEVHLILLENAEMKEEAAKVEKRLADFRKEFDKYLEN